MDELERKYKRLPFEYVLKRQHFTAADMPEHFSESFRGFLAEEETKQQQWNARWFFEDPNHVRREHRRYFLAQIRKCNDDVLTSLYGLLPAFCEAALAASHIYNESGHFLQNLAEAFYLDFLSISDDMRVLRREEIDTQLRNPNKSDARLASQQVTLTITSIGSGGIYRRPLTEDAFTLDDERYLFGGHCDSSGKEGISREFMAVYAPMYDWLEHWNIVAPWVADVAFVTLFEWVFEEVDENDVLDFCTLERDPVAFHNVTHPKLTRETATFKPELSEFWDVSTTFAQFEKDTLKKVKKELRAFERKIDQELKKMGFEKSAKKPCLPATFTQLAIRRLNPTWTWRMVVDAFEQLRALEEQEAVETSGEDKLDVALDTDNVRKNCRNLEKLLGF